MREEEERGKRATGGFFGFLLKGKRIWILVALGALGIVLLLFGAGKTKEDTADKDALSLRVEELSLYEERLEKEIEVLCEAVAGISDCTVTVTLSGGYTALYLTDGKGAPLVVGSGSDEEAVLEGVRVPSVAGVAVVCRGGRDPTAQAILTELVSTALGISANRVYVTGK